MFVPAPAMTIAPHIWKVANITESKGPPHLSMLNPIPTQRKVLTCGNDLGLDPKCDWTLFTKFVTATRVANFELLIFVALIIVVFSALSFFS